MIAITCRRCGSDNIRKNGLTKTGRQQIHCKNCNFYSTIDLKSSDRELRQQIADNLYSERLSQHAIARTLRMSRTTIRKKIKKK
jgi:transposase-like protein